MGKIRKRNDNSGSAKRPRRIDIRVTKKVSNEIASYQGLLKRCGINMTLAEVFEITLMPTLRKSGQKLAEILKKERA